MSVKRLSLQNLTNRHAKLAIALASLLILGAAGLTVHTLKSPAQPAWPMAFYYDEQSGAVTRESGSQVPPLHKSDGRVLVRAYYFTCGKADDRHLAFLERYTEEGKAVVEQQIAQGPSYRGMLSQKGRLIRKPEPGSSWVDPASAEGRKIVADLKCPEAQQIRVISVDP